MGGAPIARDSAAVTATILDEENDSSVIDLQRYSFGGFILPDAFDGTTMAFKVSSERDGDFVALRSSADNDLDEVGDDYNLIITVSQGLAYALPPEVFAFPFLKLSSDAMGGETADREIIVCLKT